MAKFAQKQANSAITTFALGAKLCKVHICNIPNVPHVAAYFALS